MAKGKRVCPNCNTFTGFGWYVVCWTYRKKRYCRTRACKCKRTGRIDESIFPIFKRGGGNIIS